MKDLADCADATKKPPRRSTCEDVLLDERRELERGITLEAVPGLGEVNDPGRRKPPKQLGLAEIAHDRVRAHPRARSTGTLICSTAFHNSSGSFALPACDVVVEAAGR